MTPNPSDEILFERRGRLGVATLNRPAALNALNRAMCVAWHRKLFDWAADDAVQAVVIQGAGDRAFCAGGDVVGLYHAGRAGTPEWEGFFRDEYRMNQAIAEYPKPYIALIDGVTMGGGVGLSVHAPYRVATERTLVAMPETGIGLIPDVGSTHALPRLEGLLGTWLGLTGARLKGAEARAAGFATHLTPADQLETLLERLADSDEPVGDVLDVFDEPRADTDVEAYRDGVDFHFAHDAVDAILASLDAGDDWALRQAEVMRRMSPTSLKLTLRLLREGAGDSVEGCLRREYRVVSAIARGHDFYEGVRAQLIDKDKTPRWSPPSLAEVGDFAIDGYFGEPLTGDLTFD